jgi:capsular polysaccharide biosynthesis protein
MIKLKYVFCHGFATINVYNTKVMVDEKEKIQEQNMAMGFLGGLITGIGTKVVLENQNAAKTFEAAKEAIKQVNEEKKLDIKAETLGQVWNLYDEAKKHEAKFEADFKKTFRIDRDNIGFQDNVEEFRHKIDEVKRDFENNKEMNTIIAVTAAVAVGVGIWVARNTLFKPSNKIEETSSIENQGLISTNLIEKNL